MLRLFLEREPDRGLNTKSKPLRAELVLSDAVEEVLWRERILGIVMV
jgi:hypothetical protein